MDVLPIVDSWIVGGDFNNVETFEDWCATSPPALPRTARSERDAWDLFLFALAGVDAWYVSCGSQAKQFAVFLGLSPSAGFAAKKIGSLLCWPLGYILWWVGFYLAEHDFVRSCACIAMSRAQILLCTS